MNAYNSCNYISRVMPYHKTCGKLVRNVVLAVMSASEPVYFQPNLATQSVDKTKKTSFYLWREQAHNQDVTGYAEQQRRQQRSGRAL